MPQAHALGILAWSLPLTIDAVNLETGSLQLDVKPPADPLDFDAVAVEECSFPAYEEDSGECVSGGTYVPYYCCSAVRACRTDANNLLADSIQRLQLYETFCGVQEAQHFEWDDYKHKVLKNDSSSLLCSSTCQSASSLQQHADFQMMVEDIQKQCVGKVEEEEWMPQLKNSFSRMELVSLLDGAWLACGGSFVTSSLTPSEAPTQPPNQPPPDTDYQPVAEDVDFGFMGQTFRRPVYGDREDQQDLYDIFGGRKMMRVTREELVNEHVCQERGDRANTYFASSLCYWFPELSERHGPLPPTTGFEGVDWKIGGNAQKSMCSGLSNVGDTTGKCLRCSVCHNAGRSEDADNHLTYSSVLEEIPLGEGCMKEVDIEVACLNQYDQENAQLIEDAQLCLATQARHSSAVSAHQKATLMLQELPRLITVEYPEKIAEHQRHLERLTSNAQSIQESEMTERRDAKAHSCKKYQEFNGYLWWYLHLGQPEVATSDILHNMNQFACGAEPADPTSDDYESLMEKYEACQSCAEARTRLQGIHSGYLDVSGNVTAVQQEIDVLQGTHGDGGLVNLISAFDDWRHRELEQKRILEDAEAEWLPVEESCKEKVESVQNGRPEHVRSCAPSHYNQSCEKACLEQQNSGCGIMEGVKPKSEGPLHGGVEVTCRPPQPSWVSSPWTYDAPVESSTAQCERILQHQRPAYAQTNLKSGWLKMRRSGMFWKRRYFVLEAGDKVRSGILRYFDRDAGQPEEVATTGVDIILWDATSVEEEVHLLKKCIKLTHFYRTFWFCDEESEESQTEWTTLIRSEIDRSGARYSSGDE